MKTFRIAAILFIALYMGLGFWVNNIRASDQYIRGHVVKLYNEKKGQCTATSIHAKSGRIYLLTAAHCRELLDKGQAIAEREDGTKFKTTLIAYDAEHDLMLMTSEEKHGLLIGGDVGLHEHVHSLTHGGGHATYRSDGEWLEEGTEVIALGPIASEKERRDCIKEKNQSTAMGFFRMMCVLKARLGHSTMVIIPGSSGGSVLNDSGEVIAVVSAYNPNENISLLVPTRFIRAFLANY